MDLWKTEIKVTSIFQNFFWFILSLSFKNDLLASASKRDSLYSIVSEDKDEGIKSRQTLIVDLQDKVKRIREKKNGEKFEVLLISMQVMRNLFN